MISRDLLLGQIAAVIFCLGALSLAGYCASLGAEWVGSIVGGGTIAAVVIAFLKTRSER